MNNCLVFLVLHILYLDNEDITFPTSYKRPDWNTYPAYVCDMELGRLCIVESQQQMEKTWPPSPCPQCQLSLVCVATPEGPELHKAKPESDSQKTEKHPEGCSHLGLLGWRVSRSYCQFPCLLFRTPVKRAASTGCAEATNSYLFQLNVIISMRLKFHTWTRKIQWFLLPCYFTFKLPWNCSQRLSDSEQFQSTKDCT